jgi:3-oxoacyl-[acyl-carrier protein] reductase
MAERFISEGADVLITGRNAAQLEEIAGKIGCKYLSLDVQDVNSFADFFKKADELLGGINCLVNNAGVSLHEQNIRTVTPEGFDTQINTNLRGSYFLSQHFIKLAESANRKDCSILFISSERGLFVDDIPYGLTKAAINSLVQGLAVRVLPSGIRVNAIAPGITASDMTGYSTDGNLFCNYNASKRVFLPEEVSETACFLLSDCSRCVTGQIIACDQGRAINPHWRRN